jgi:hypothetical protein
MFDRWKPEIDGETTRATNIDKIAGAIRTDIRAYGHLAANIDPLGSDPPGDPSLDITAHGLTKENLNQLPPSLVGGPIAEQAVNAQDAIESLFKIYTSKIGFDYDHIHIPEEREWLRLTAESGRFRPPKDSIDPKVIRDPYQGGGFNAFTVYFREISFHRGHGHAGTDVKRDTAGSRSRHHKTYWVWPIAGG